MSIPRKLKICKTCGDPSYLWSNGNCKRCAGLIKLSEKKPFKPLTQTNDGRVAKAFKIAPVSAKRAEQLKLYRVVRDEFLKGKKCEYPGCTVDHDLDLHHGAGRVGKLLCDVRFFKALCRKHHIYVGDHPDKAIELKLSYKRLDKVA